jgi:hypothetical protein
MSFRLSEEYEVKDRTYRGHGRVENDFRETLRISRTVATLRYGLTDDWSLEVGLSNPRFAYALTPPGGSRTKRTFRGPGDSEVLVGRSFLLSEPDEADDLRLFPEFDDPPVLGSAVPPDAEDVRGPRLSVWAGTSIPTGSAERPNPEVVTRDVSVTNLQTGTGTFDPMLRARLDLPALGVDWFAELGARVPVVENRYDYRTGASVGVVVGGRVPLVEGLDAGLAVTWQDVDRDEFDGENVAVGGGRWIYVTPSIAWEIAERVTLDVSVRITAVRDVETKLVDSGRSVQVGLNWRF